MNISRYCLLALCLIGLSSTVSASTMSLTGTLAGPTDTFQLQFNVNSTSNITLQTWGFGGGKNAAGNTISAGGFDPFISFFDASGNIVDIGGDPTNPAGTSDTLSNYSSFAGCPPAGTVAFSNGDNVCGDITMSFQLAAGSYSVVLSDANYEPFAVFDNGNLSEGFSDLTGGAFQTCDINSGGSIACITPDANWAFDLSGDIGSSAPAPVPEPSTLALVVSGLGLCLSRLRASRNS